MKGLTLVAVVAVLALVRSAQADFTFNFDSGFQNGGVIPDGSLTGWTDTRTLSQAGTIQSVKVGLTLSGGWNGDLYASLVHDTGFAVLLNRVGRNDNTSPGFGTAGMNVVLSDAGPGGDIHLVSTPTLAGGPYAPDGRNIKPTLGDFTNPERTALLSSFSGVNLNGSWTLFIADVAGGDHTTITHWDLEIASVPEPASLVEGSVAVLFLGGVIGLYRLKGTKEQAAIC